MESRQSASNHGECCRWRRLPAAWRFAGHSRGAHVFDACGTHATTTRAGCSAEWYWSQAGPQVFARQSKQTTEVGAADECWSHARACCGCALFQLPMARAGHIIAANRTQTQTHIRIRSSGRTHGYSVFCAAHPLCAMYSRVFFFFFGPRRFNNKTLAVPCIACKTEYQHCALYWLAFTATTAASW